MRKYRTVKSKTPIFEAPIVMLEELLNPKEQDEQETKN